MPGNDPCWFLNLKILGRGRRIPSRLLIDILGNRTSYILEHPKEVDIASS